MRLKELWDLQRSFIIGLNVYLILSLNFVGIFCHGRPPSISHQHFHHRGENHSYKGQRSGGDGLVRVPQRWSWNRLFNLARSRGHLPANNFARRSSPTGENSATQDGQKFNPSLSLESKLKFPDEDAISSAVPAEKLVSRPNILPPIVRQDRGGGSKDDPDTIDLSAISHTRNSFRNPQTKSLEPKKKPRIRISMQDRIENSIDRFDAFGDYEYIDTEDYPLVPGNRFRPLPQRRPPNNQRRRVDFEPQRPPSYGGYIPANSLKFPSHKFQQFHPQPPRNPHVTSLGYRPGPPRRKDPRPPTFQRPNTIPYHDPAAANQVVPVSHFLPTTPAPSFFSSVFGQGKDPRPGGGSGFGIANALYNYLADDGNPIEKHDPYNTPYYPVGYHDYEYGDYDEGVGLYPPKKQTFSERVWKWFDGFKMPSVRRSPARRPPIPGEKLSRPPGPLDYADYETGEDENLIFYNQNEQPNFGKPHEYKYDFQDVMQALRNNETGVEIAKKFLSAAASLTERQDSSNSVFMMWTIPTTILALLGAVYFIGAIAIVGYKSFLFANNSGQAVNLIPVVIALSLPLVLGFFIVTSRASARGEINIGQLMRGDVGASMRQDFDGVDFTMDAMFGSASLLGIAWLLSIAI